MIRPYREGDIEQIIEIWRAASLIATPFMTADFMENESRQIRDVWIPQAETWVYETDGQVAGFIALVDHEVGGIFVHPRFQGRGFGRALMDRAVSLRASLGLDVFEKNRIGRRFYGRYGFREVGRRIHEGTGWGIVRLEFTPDDSTSTEAAT